MCPVRSYLAGRRNHEESGPAWDGGSTKLPDLVAIADGGGSRFNKQQNDRGDVVTLEHGGIFHAMTSEASMSQSDGGSSRTIGGSLQSSENPHGFERKRTLN